MSATQQALLSSGNSIVPGTFDAYTSGIFAGIGLTRLRSSAVYSGAVLKVRRASDNATLDIGFVGAAIDSAAIATFCGASDGFVDTWYDQFGGGNHFSAASTSAQPAIYASSAYLGYVGFDGTNDGLSCVNSTATSTAKSFFRDVPSFTTRSGNQLAILHADDSSGTNITLQGNHVNTPNAGEAAYYLGTAGFTGYSQAGWFSTAGGNWIVSKHGLVLLCGTSPGYNGIQLYKPTIVLHDTGSQASVGTQPTSYPASKWHIGGGGSPSPALMQLKTHLFYDADKSTDAATIVGLL